MSKGGEKTGFVGSTALMNTGGKILIDTQQCDISSKCLVKPIDEPCSQNYEGEH